LIHPPASAKNDLGLNKRDARPVILWKKYKEELAGQVRCEKGFCQAGLQSRQVLVVVQEKKESELIAWSKESSCNAANLIGDVYGMSLTRKMISLFYCIVSNVREIRMSNKIALVIHGVLYMRVFIGKKVFVS
jgi:hypothetical protein